MEDTKKGFIIVIAIVIVASLAIFAAFSMGLMKSDTKVNMAGNSFTQDEKLVVTLKNESGYIKNKTIHFKFINKKGKVNEYSVKTNGKGEAKLALKEIKPGTYTVNVSFEGDDMNKPSNQSKQIEVKEAVEQQESVYVEPAAASNQQTASSGDSDVAGYRDFVSWDFAPGEHIRETTYKDGDIKREYDDGSSEYYDSSAHEWRYKDADGRQSSMYVG